MATLHVLSHSPYADRSLESCLRVLGKQDGLLLSGDAVYALQGSEASNRLTQVSAALYALDEDVTARNISAAHNAQLVDYTAFVELCCQYDKVNAWL
ncbi:sulfurtransferase complex subunit TusB [Ectopseudomonas mendocina]|uniref:Sulfurtransferase complex subunit TusB n=1 Tax=Ectopseudomonas mendocina TaxID=300 RepID=A0ABZ2RNB1_ECTME